jgi:hypothetical protein
MSKHGHSTRSFVKNSIWTLFKNTCRVEAIHAGNESIREGLDENGYLPINQTIRKPRSKKIDYCHMTTLKEKKQSCTCTSPAHHLHTEALTLSFTHFIVSTILHRCQWSPSCSSMFRHCSFCHIQGECYRHNVPSVAEPFPASF